MAVPLQTPSFAGGYWLRSYATFNCYQPSDGTHGEPERHSGLEVDHIVVNGLTERAPDVL